MQIFGFIIINMTLLCLIRIGKCHASVNVHTYLTRIQYSLKCPCFAGWWSPIQPTSLVSHLWCYLHPLFYSQTHSNHCSETLLDAPDSCLIELYNQFHFSVYIATSDVPQNLCSPIVKISYLNVSFSIN